MRISLVGITPNNFASTAGARRIRVLANKQVITHPIQKLLLYKV